MVWDPKDPWSRKSDPLEDVLKQAQVQLRNFLPKGGLRNILLAGLLIFLAWQSAFIIGPDEEGVVKRFGMPVRTVGPGPHMKIPIVESVLQPKVAKLHRVEIGFRTDRQSRQQMIPQEALMLTGDMNILAIEFIVQYKIKESSDFLFNVADIHDTIGKAAEASMREVIGKSKIAAHIGHGCLDRQANHLLRLGLGQPFQSHSAIQNRIHFLTVHPLCLEIVVNSLCQLNSALVGGYDQNDEIRFLNQRQADA